MSTQPLATRVRGEPVLRLPRARKLAGLPPVLVGYRYLAVLEDGTEEVIRGLTTTRYEWAYQWLKKVTAGKSGLAAYFTYSTQRQKHTGPVAEFSIEWI